MKNEIGAFWERESKSGVLYLSGKIKLDGKEIEIVAFKEKEKRSEKMPDWRVYESEPRA